MSVRSPYAIGLLAATIATPLLGGCEADTDGRSTYALSAGCPEPTPDVVFFDDFNSDLSKWIRFTSDPTDSAHNWAISSAAPVYAGPSQLRSDPGGPTKPEYYNRLDSVPISLEGRKNVRLRFVTRHDLASVGDYQVFIRNLNGDKVSLIGDYAGKNLAWPSFEQKDIPIPQAFWGDPSVRISFLMQAGPAGGDFGAEVDNVLLVGEPEAAQCDLAFFDSFEGGNLAKWDVYNDPGTPGHVWGLGEAPATSCTSANEARSDLAGSTQKLNYTRLETKPFSLVGKSFATIRLQARWKMGGDDRFQIFIADRDTANVRGLIREYLQQNPSYPANDSIEIPIPSFMMGRGRVSAAFLALTGAAGIPGTGVAIDDVKIITNCTGQ
jgi:hypothetical protein